jgi:hypothetical protein
VEKGNPRLDLGYLRSRKLERKVDREKAVIMRFLGWNIRGQGQIGRVKQLREMIIQEKVDIVGILETIKQHFSSKNLKMTEGSNCFLWKWVPAKGHYGGILLEVKVESLEVEGCEIFKHAIKVIVRDRRSNLRWGAIYVYGPAQHHLLNMFLEEMSEICDNEPLPIVLGGDFNLIRNQNEKNSTYIDQKRMDMFSDFITNHKLRKLSRGGPKFTWSNKQVNPVLVKLDRFSISTKWEENFMLSFSKGLTRVSSGENYFQATEIYSHYLCAIRKIVICSLPSI